MNIVIVTHEVRPGDGQGRVNYEVVQEILRRGYTVTIVSSRIDPALAKHPQVTWVSIPVDGWPSNLIKYFVFSLKTAQWLRKHRARFDIVKFNGVVSWGPSDVNAAHFVHHAWRQSPYHTSRVQHGPYAWYQWLYSTIHSHLERMTFQQARVVVAVSDQVRRDLIANDVPADSIQVIVNGVNIEEFAPGESERAKYNLPEDKTIALFAGDIRSPRKNLDTLLKALVHVPDLHVAVAGGIKGSPYPDMAVQLGVAERVHFLDHRRDIASVMRSVDLFVFPSRYDPCPLVILEALGSGLPIVTSRRVGSSNLVTPDCGFVLDHPDDITGLTQVLQTLTLDPEKRQQMSLAARAIGERHSFTDMAAQYVDLFEEICQEKNR